MLRVKILLLIIFLLALVLRFYKLSDFPVGFHIDEASLGYNGYSLLMTGRDDNGHTAPLYIDMFGDNRPSGYHYLTVLPIKIFGLNEFATRFPGALFGSLGIFAIYYFVRAVFQSSTVGLLSALLLAVAPWNIVLSRASAESVVALFFILFGFYFLVLSVLKRKLLLLFASTFLLALSFLLYHTPRVFVPMMSLLFVYMLFVPSQRISSKFKVSMVVSFISLCIFSFFLVFLINGGQGRFNQVSIFSNPGTQLILDEQIREDGVVGTGVLLTRVFHNKIINQSWSFFSNYFEYFSGEFLFVKGGLPIWYQVPSHGLIYLISLPFILIGIFHLAKSNELLHKIPLAWILIAPITASVTVDDIPNINRAIVLFPLIEAVAAYGFITVLRSSKFSKAVIGVSSLVLLFSLGFFLHQYFIHAKIHKTLYRNNGFKEMILSVKESYDIVDKIIVTKTAGGIYPLVQFYMQYDPGFYQREGSVKDRDNNGFGKFYFVSDTCPSENSSYKNKFPGKIIYINKGDCGKSNSQIVDDVFREDGSLAFRMVYE